MLKLNVIQYRGYALILNLNTSHVKVKLFSQFFINTSKNYLNTSHVKVKLTESCSCFVAFNYLNTSHVKVKHIPKNRKGKSK